jgi:hypothetical protein
MNLVQDPKEGSMRSHRINPTVCFQVIVLSLQCRYIQDSYDDSDNKVIEKVSISLVLSMPCMHFIVMHPKKSLQFALLLLSFSPHINQNMHPHLAVYFTVVHFMFHSYLPMVQPKD